MARRREENSRLRLSRRGLFGAAAGGAIWLGGLGPSRAETQLGAPDSATKIDFRIVRKGSAVGYHRIAIAPSGDGMTVTTSIRITVQVVFVTAFRYEHDCSEVWAAGRLQSLVSTTDNDGDKLRVAGKATANGIEMNGPSGPFTAPADALTTNSLWSRAFLNQSQIIDTQNGGMIGLTSKSMGAEKKKILNVTLPTERYDLVTPYLMGEIWYSADNRWVKSAFEWQGERIGYDLEA